VRFGDQSVVSNFWTLPYPGVYVRVLLPGEVKTGDEIIRIESNSESLSLSQVFSIFRSNNENHELMQKAIAEPFIAESCRRNIEKLLFQR
jgi:MOSC domain-containing protein YiiM